MSVCPPLAMVNFTRLMDCLRLPINWPGNELQPQQWPVINTLRLGQNGCFCRYFETHFLEKKFLYPPAQRSCWRGYWFHSVRPSVHLSRVCSVAPTVLVGSISYLYILSSNFRRYVTCKVVGKIPKFVWVIMGRRGVSQNAGVLVVLVLFELHWKI